MSLIPLEEFKYQLSCHDWYYYFSDDHRVYSAGEADSNRLKAIADAGNDDYKRAYNEAYALRFNTPSFVTPESPFTYPYPDLV